MDAVRVEHEAREPVLAHRAAHEARQLTHRLWTLLRLRNQGAGADPTAPAVRGVMA
jgi:hypothetical protein